MGNRQQRFVCWRPTGVAYEGHIWHQQMYWKMSPSHSKGNQCMHFQYNPSPKKLLLLGYQHPLQPLRMNIDIRSSKGCCSMSSSYSTSMRCKHLLMFMSRWLSWYHVKVHSEGTFTRGVWSDAACGVLCLTQAGYRNMNMQTITEPLGRKIW